MSEQSTALQTVWLVGGDVEGSLSPILHKSAYKAMGLPYTYAACSVNPAMLEAFLLDLQCYGALGCNVTAPYKESVYRFLSREHTDFVAELSEEAGAVDGPEITIEQRIDRRTKEQYTTETVIRIKGQLTEKQFRRLWMYCVNGMTEQQIADREKVGQQRISKSINAAIKKIKKIF